MGVMKWVRDETEGGEGKKCSERRHCGDAFEIKIFFLVDFCFRLEEKERGPFSYFGRRLSVFSLLLLLLLMKPMRLSSLLLQVAVGRQLWQ